MTAPTGALVPQTWRGASLKPHKESYALPSSLNRSYEHRAPRGLIVWGWGCGMGTHLTEYGIGWMPRTVKSGLQILLAAKRKRENSFTERKTTPGKTKPPLFAAPIPSTLAWENTARSQPCIRISLNYQDTELQSSGETEL